MTIEQTNERINRSKHVGSLITSGYGTEYKAARNTFKKKMSVAYVRPSPLTAFNTPDRTSQPASVDSKHGCRELQFPTILCTPQVLVSLLLNNYTYVQLSCVPLQAIYTPLSQPCVAKPCLLLSCFLCVWMFLDLSYCFWICGFRLGHV